MSINIEIELCYWPSGPVARWPDVQEGPDELVHLLIIRWFKGSLASMPGYWILVDQIAKGSKWSMARVVYLWEHGSSVFLLLLHGPACQLALSSSHLHTICSRSIVSILKTALHLNLTLPSVTFDNLKGDETKNKAS